MIEVSTIKDNGDTKPFAKEDFDLAGKGTGN
jgi:hypothetical protein